MKTPTEIVNDTRAFLTSTAATVAGVAASVVTLATGVVIFVPDQYADIKAGIVAAGAIAGVVGGAARQLYAWLDPNNPSFGRVAIEVDPGAHLPGDAEPEDISPEELALIEGPEPEPNEPDLTEEDIDPPTDGPQDDGAA